MKRVCHITTVHRPFDDRIFFKQCRSLAAAGFHVTLVAPVDREQEEDGVLLVPVRVPRNRLLRATLGAWRALRVAKALHADVYEVHDPELLWIGLLLKRRGNRLIYDMHESMRAHILTKAWAGSRWSRKFLAYVYGVWEDRAVQRFDAVLLAVETMKEEMIARHPRHVQKFLVIRNLPVLRIIDREIAPLPAPVKPTLIYAGGISRTRGIKEVIQALDILGDVRLKLLGTFSDQVFQHECEALPGWRKVDHAGHLRMDHVYDHMRAAHLGVCLLHPLHNYMLSRPIKAYEYMACRLPMVMSDFPVWRKEFSACAWFTDPQDPSAIAAAVREALADAEGAAVRGRMGRSMVEQEWSWEREADRLVDLYRRLLS